MTMNRFLQRFTLRFIVTITAWFGVIMSAFASTTGSLPWDTPLQTITNDLTGPVATALSTGGLFAAGGTLIWGGELGGFVAMCLRIVAAIALLSPWREFLKRPGAHRCHCAMTTATPRAIPLHRALIRPILLLGAERELVLSAALLAAGLIFSVHEWWSVVTGAGLWLLSLAALQRMAKADPLLSQVLARHLRYQRFYPAKPTPFGRGWSR